VNFNVGLGLPGLAKVLLAAVLAVIILLVALVWFVVWRVRRRNASRQSAIGELSMEVLK
jgi:uncharacterized membrane protein